MKSVQKILPLLVIAVFAASALLLMASGAEAYKSAVEKASDADALRTASRYITTRIRTAPSPGAVKIEPFGETDALVIEDSEIFSTLIYAYNGYLMEACVVKNGLADPSGGSRLVPLDSLAFNLDNDGTLSIDGRLHENRAFHVQAILQTGRQPA